jgi:hypothetical protein
MFTARTQTSSSKIYRYLGIRPFTIAVCAFLEQFPCYARQPGNRDDPVTFNDDLRPSVDLSHAELLLLFLAALTVRIAYIIWLSSDPTLFLAEDSSYFVQLAENLAATGHFVAGEFGAFYSETERVPGYILFVALVRAVFGTSPITLAVIQSFIDSGTVVLIALIIRPAGRTVMILSGTLAAIWPNLVIHSALVLTDTLFVFFLTATLLYCIRYLNRPSATLAIAIGLLLGCTIMTRAIVQFLPPIFVTVIVVAAWRYGFGLRKTLLCGIVFAVATALPTTPILYRNISQYSVFALTAQGGNHLMNWVVPLVRVYSEGMAFGTASAEIRARFENEPQTTQAVDLNAFEEDKRRADFAIQQLSSQPIGPVIGAWVRGMVINLAAPAVAIEPRMRRQRQDSFLEARGGLPARTLAWLGTSPQLWLTVMLFGIVGSAVTLLLQIWGYFRLTSFAPWPAAFCAGLILYFLLIMGPVAAPKYRLPLEPVMVVLAALAIADLSMRFRDRRARKLKGAP